MFSTSSFPTHPFLHKSAASNVNLFRLLLAPCEGCNVAYLEPPKSIDFQRAYASSSNNFPSTTLIQPIQPCCRKSLQRLYLETCFHLHTLDFGKQMDRMKSVSLLCFSAPRAETFLCKEPAGSAQVMPNGVVGVLSYAQ